MNIRILSTIAVATLYLLPAQAQEDRLEIAAAYDMYFDNKEYAHTAYAEKGLDIESGTDFAGRLVASLQYVWDEKNRLVFGVQTLNNFGEKSDKYFAEVKPIAYYQFQSAKVRAVAGIFTRDLLNIGSYSSAFFSESHNFFNNRVSGVAVQRNNGRTFFEFACDWEGQYSDTSREKFRLLSAYRKFWGDFYAGYNFSMFHFAGQANAVKENVVDQLIGNPCIGWQQQSNWNLDFKLGAILTAQNDRSFSDGWQHPVMGEVAAKVEHKGFYLDQELYFGDNLYPFYYGHTLEDGTYMPYGRELYPGEGFFRTTYGLYNRLAVGYGREFFDKTVKVSSEVASHYDGYGLGTQYFLRVAIRLNKVIYKSK